MLTRAEMYADGEVRVIGGPGASRSLLEAPARAAVLRAIENLAGMIEQLSRPTKIARKPSERKEILNLMAELAALCRSCGLDRKPPAPRPPEEIPGTPEYCRLNGTPGYYEAVLRGDIPPRTGNSGLKPRSAEPKTAALPTPPKGEFTRGS